MSSNALLLVMMEPPAALEDEFNDWYDTEHFPQRKSMPGFMSASRWACVDGWPRWVALYDLESADALQTADYLAASGAHSTPWSKRMLARTCGRRRVIATALPASEIESEIESNGATVSRLLVACYPGVSHADSPDSLLALARERLSARADVIHIRGFVENQGGRDDLWLLVTFKGPLGAAVLHEPIGMLKEHGAEVFNLYAPYARG